MGRKLEVYGGNFDGMCGIIVGLEVVRMLRDQRITLKNPVEIMGTHDEEGIRYGTGFFGTKAMMGEVNIDYLKNFKDCDGISIYDSMVSYGLDPTQINKARHDYKKECAYPISTGRKILKTS